jgi:RNase P subunit RPR2
MICANCLVPLMRGGTIILTLEGTKKLVCSTCLQKLTHNPNTKQKPDREW